MTLTQSLALVAVLCVLAVLAFMVNEWRHLAREIEAEAAHGRAGRGVAK